MGLLICQQRCAHYGRCSNVILALKAYYTREHHRSPFETSLLEGIDKPACFEPRPETDFQTNH